MRYARENNEDDIANEIRYDIRNGNDFTDEFDVALDELAGTLKSFSFMEDFTSFKHIADALDGETNYKLSISTLLDAIRSKAELPSGSAWQNIESGIRDASDDFYFQARSSLNKKDYRDDAAGTFNRKKFEADAGQEALRLSAIHAFTNEDYLINNLADEAVDNMEGFITEKTLGRSVESVSDVLEIEVGAVTYRIIDREDDGAGATVLKKMNGVWQSAGGYSTLSDAKNNAINELMDNGHADNLAVGGGQFQNMSWYTTEGDEKALLPYREISFDSKNMYRPNKSYRVDVPQHLGGEPLAHARMGAWKSSDGQKLSVINEMQSDVVQEESKVSKRFSEQVVDIAQFESKPEDLMKFNLLKNKAVPYSAVKYADVQAADDLYESAYTELNTVLDDLVDVQENILNGYDTEQSIKDYDDVNILLEQAIMKLTAAANSSNQGIGNYNRIGEDVSENIILASDKLIGNVIDNVRNYVRSKASDSDDLDSIDNAINSPEDLAAIENNARGYVSSNIFSDKLFNMTRKYLTNNPQIMNANAKAARLYQLGRFDIDTINERVVERHSPNNTEAPMKKNWEVSIFKQLAADAVKNNLDGIAWPSTKEQIAEIQGFEEIRYNAETKKYILPRKKPVDVTPIVNRYLKALPKIAAKFSKEFGGDGKIETTEIETKAGTKKVNYIKLPERAKEKAKNKGFPLFELSSMVGGGAVLNESRDRTNEPR